MDIAFSVHHCLLSQFPVKESSKSAFSITSLHSLALYIEVRIISSIPRIVSNLKYIEFISIFHFSSSPRAIEDEKSSCGFSWNPTRIIIAWRGGVGL